MARAPSGDAIDIVVPVFGAAAELDRCLASVRRHTDPRRSRLLVVLDGPQAPEIEGVIAGHLAAFPLETEVIRRAARAGFAASVNAGIERGDRDVVLLNSDTEVTAAWLDKLAEAAASATDIASVTPFSNSATICSLPRWLEENALPAGFSLDAFSRLVEECAVPARPELPTGVGFCLYLRRAALREVGALDAGRFGLGYGEEVEWCLRASRLGWRHVLDDATFVYHAGQASFGTERGGRVRAAERRMRLGDREAWRRLGEFVRRNPLAPLRQRVIARLQPAHVAGGGPRVLHVVHGWPPWNHAGTELYAARLARWQAARRETTALARIAHPRRPLGAAVELLDHGVRVRLLVNNFAQRNPISRAAIRDSRLERDFGRLLDETRPDLVHVHHLAGLCASLPALARRRGVPVVYQVQDWWTVCARANLLDSNRRPCSGPGLRKCSECLPLTGRAPALANPLLYAWRGRALRRAFRSADAWIMGSEFIAATFRDFGLLRVGDLARVLPYGLDAPPPPSGAGRGGPLRVGFIGSLLPHKGAHVAIRAFAQIPADTAILEVWGTLEASPDYARELRAAAGPSVAFHGSFPEGDEEARFAALDVLVVPSLGLESYGIAPREAIARGVYVIASRRGALAELAGLPEHAALFDPERPDELRALILAMAADPSWRARRARIPAPRLPTLAEHATAVEEVYTEVLARRRRAPRSP